MDFNSKYTGPQVEEQLDKVNNKQDVLVSGENIKTINGSSILGKGDITVNSATPDWNASKGEAGYIKNRTHYSSSETKTLQYRGDELEELVCWGGSQEDVAITDFPVTIKIHNISYYGDFKDTATIKDSNSVAEFSYWDEMGECWLPFAVARVEEHNGDYYLKITRVDTLINGMSSEEPIEVTISNLITLDEKYIPDSVRSMPVKKVNWEFEGLLLEPNVYHKNVAYYMYSDCSLYLAPPHPNVVNEYIVEFTLGWDEVYISLPSGVIWLNDDVPEFEPEYTYVISIVNNVAVYEKYWN